MQDNQTADMDRPGEQLFSGCVRVPIEKTRIRIPAAARGGLRENDVVKCGLVDLAGGALSDMALERLGRERVRILALYPLGAYNHLLERLSDPANLVPERRTAHNYFLTRFSDVYIQQGFRLEMGALLENWPDVQGATDLFALGWGSHLRLVTTDVMEALDQQLDDETLPASQMLLAAEAHCQHANVASRIGGEAAASMKLVTETTAPQLSNDINSHVAYGGPIVRIAHATENLWARLALFITTEYHLDYTEHHAKRGFRRPLSEVIGECGLERDFLIVIVSDDKTDSSGVPQVLKQLRAVGEVDHRRVVALVQQGHHTEAVLDGIECIPFVEDRISDTFERLRQVLAEAGLLTDERRQVGCRGA